PMEGGLAAIQIAVGSVGMLATFIPIGLLLAASEPVGGLSILVAPTAGGFIVCAVGGTSRYYEGGCAPAVLGACLGALTTIPLTFLGCSFDQPRGDVGGCDTFAAIGFVTGLFVGTAAGATLAWHLAKKPKPPIRLSGRALPRPALADAWSEWRRSSFAATPLRGARLLIPLFAFEF